MQSLLFDALLLFCVFLRVFAVPSVELFNTASGAHVTLFAGEERMALGANVHAQFLLYATGFKSIAATTDYGALPVLRMNSLFIVKHLSLSALIYPDINAYALYHIRKPDARKNHRLGGEINNGLFPHSNLYPVFLGYLVYFLFRQLRPLTNLRKGCFIR